MARRANGEGTVYKLADGRWRGTVSAKVAGKLVRKSITRSKRADVVANMDRLRGELAGGLFVDRDCTLAEYLDSYVENYVKAECRPHTISSYERSIRLHIKSRLPTIKLAKLNASHIEAFKAAMAADGVGTRARQYAYAVLVRALRRAVYPLRLITANPAEGVKPPSHTAAKMRPFEATEARAILDDSAGTRWHAFYAVAFGCGLRIGELFGLTWNDIDFVTGRLHVQRQAIDQGGRVSVTPPKTAHSVRFVDMPGNVIKALREHQAIQLRAGFASNDWWVFPTLSGGLYSRSNFYNDEWKVRLVRCGIPHRGIHHTRHTFATLALTAGVPVAVVAKALGHASPAITLQTYCHALPSSESAAAVALGKLLG